MIDICIVTCNRKEYLERCIWSIIASASEECRIFVIDDNSQDGTVDFLTEMVGRGLIYKVIFNDNKLGTARNFNKIIDASDSRWFVMANDDMWFHKGWDKAVRAISENYDTCGAVSFYDYARIDIDPGVEKINDWSWKVARTGLGATYMNRDTFEKAGKFVLPNGKLMGFFATPFCVKMSLLKLTRKEIYHTPGPFATHMDDPKCLLNERKRYEKYNTFRRIQKNGR